MSALEGLKEKERRIKVRELTVRQAQEELAEQRRKLFDLRMGMMRGEQRDVREFARTRKDIARLLYKLRMVQIFGDESEFAGTEEEEVVEEEAPKAEKTPRGRATKAVAPVAEEEPEAEADDELDADEDDESEETDDESEADDVDESDEDADEAEEEEEEPKA